MAGLHKSLLFFFLLCSKVCANKVVKRILAYHLMMRFINYIHYNSPVAIAIAIILWCFFCSLLCNMYMDRTITLNSQYSIFLSLSLLTSLHISLYFVDIRPCSSQPCLNGGTCVEGTNQYKCNCPPEWRGTNCQSKTPTGIEHLWT